MRPKSIPQAFTLIELLVVIAIISVSSPFCAGGAGGREAARRIQCVNNLKQIGLCLHNYMSTTGVFPPGRFNTYVAGDGQCWGAIPSSCRNWTRRTSSIP